MSKTSEETKELLKKVRRIEIRTRGISNHIFAGEYHSAFKGRGMSFSEVREYQYGDDVRNIDWNVTARFDQPYVKVFEEERELTVMLIVDISGSAHFGTNHQMKNDLITELCAIVAFSAIHNNDKVGLIFFSDEIELFIPPKKGRSHILRIIRELIQFKPEKKQTNISEALKYFNNVMKKRSIAFLLSDFKDNNYDEALKIAGKKHDIVGIRIFDKFEEQLPDVGLLQLMDLETGKTKWIDSSSKQIRKAFVQWNLERKRNFKDAFLKSRSDQLEIETGSDHIKSLLGFFKKRA